MSQENRPEEGSGEPEIHFPQTFRPSVLLIYLLLSIPMQLIYAAVFVVHLWIDFRAKGLTPTADDLLLGALASVCVGLFTFPMALRWAHRSRVRVGPFGIETRDERGFRSIFSWSGIESVDASTFWGLRILQIKTITGRLAWLPVYVARGEAYREAVAHFAGEDHPVSRALATSSPSSSR